MITERNNIDQLLAVRVKIINFILLWLLWLNFFPSNWWLA